MGFPATVDGRTQLRLAHVVLHPVVPVVGLALDALPVHEGHRDPGTARARAAVDLPFGAAPAQEAVADVVEGEGGEMGVDLLGGLGVPHALVDLQDAEVEHAAFIGVLVGAHHPSSAARVHDAGHPQARHLAAAVVHRAHLRLVVPLRRTHRDQPRRVAQEHPRGDLHFTRPAVHRQGAHLAEDPVLVVEPVQVLEPPVGPGGGVGVVDAHEAEGGGIDRDAAVDPAQANGVFGGVLVDLPAGEGPLVLVFVPAPARDPLARLGVEALHEVGDKLSDLVGAHRVAQVVLERRFDAQL